MENIRKHGEMKLVTTREKFNKYKMKPNFKDGYAYLKGLLHVEMGKTEIKRNKPVYLGQTILD